MKRYIALLTPSQYNESDLHRNTYRIARFLLIHSSTATDIFFILIMILLIIIIIITTSCHLFCNKNVKIYNSMIAGQELFDEYQNSYVSKKLSFYFVFYLQPACLPAGCLSSVVTATVGSVEVFMNRHRFWENINYPCF